MTQEFDPHAAIRKLAVAEWPGACLCHYNPETGYRFDIVCPKHDGTGRIVPFASLRKPCRARVRPMLVLPDSIDTEGDAEAERKYQERFHKERCGCKGLLWVPEPDLEKACWRLHELGYEGQTKEAVLRAALEWDKEQQERGERR